MTEITHLHRRTTEPVESLAFPGHGVPGKSGWDATADHGGATLHLSRLDGETGWTVDALIPAGTSCPAYMNGWGARYLATRPAPPEVAALLDQATTTPARKD